jgi:hypothetical protein
VSLKPYRQVFPQLTDDNHVETSPHDATYNCIGHAAGTRLWWEPGPTLGGALYWPPNVPQEKTIASYVEAYATKGYVECSDGDFEPGFEKVALYALNGTPQHAARQLDGTYWTSKLGQGEDISHQLDDLAGSFYGYVIKYLKRPNPSN